MVHVHSRVAPVVAAAALTVCAAACGPNGPTVNNTPVAATATTAAPAPVTAAPAAHVGQAINVQAGEAVTVMKVIDPAQGGDQYTQPDAGKRFVGVELKVADTGHAAGQGDVNNDVALIGADNQTYTADFSAIAGCTNFDHGAVTLAPGQSATGCVTFQLPAGVTVAKVQYQPSGLSGNVSQWVNP